MSLRGVISVEDTDNVGGFAAAVGKFKEGIANITGVSMSQGSNKTPLGKLTIEGIVQGEIKLQAINDWKTTLFYGFSDAASNVGVSGTNASAILKFSNTVMNAMGYTLGGTGPASKKMYGGSNLNGFNLQFKWYTPYMNGWQGAIRNLGFLAWPTAIGADASESALQSGVKTPTQSDKELQEAEYKQIIANCKAHRSAIQKFRAILDSCHTDGMEESQIMSELGKKFGQGQDFKYTDLQKCAKIAAHIAVNGGVGGYFGVGGIPGIESNLIASHKLDGVVMNIANIRGELQLNATDIGYLTIPAEEKVWYDLGPAAPVNPAATKLRGDGDKAQATKEINDAANPSIWDAVPGGGLIKGSLAFADGVGDLLKGLMASFAANPPIVNLKIYSGTEVKYELTPLVITSFAITASRETMNGNPVIVTIDISFDYYQVNSTLSPATKARQTFAGVPIFRTGDE